MSNKFGQMDGLKGHRAEQPGDRDEWAIRFLPQADQDLLVARMHRGVPLRVLARFLGVGPSAVSWRIGAMLRRVRSEEFRKAAAAFPFVDVEDARLIGLAYFQGLGHRAIGNNLGVSIHEVRKRLDYLRGTIQAVCEREQMYARAVKAFKDGRRRLPAMQEA